MADRSQDTVTDSLRSWGMWTFKASDTIQVASQFGGGKSTLIKPKQPGRADVIAGWNGQLIFIEVKDGKKSFAFNQWEAHQREWAYGIETACKLDYWLFLVMGLHNPNWNREKYLPKRAFLMPRTTLLSVEETLKPYQATLPYKASKGYGKVLQEQKLDAVHLLSTYELPWSSGVYTLPMHHPFYLTYQPPLKDVRQTWIETISTYQEKISHDEQITGSLSA